MKAADVMVSPVITVGRNTTVQEVADILLRNRISAVPVLSQQGKILGIVSEGDLLRRVELGTQRHRSWWLELLTTKFTLQDEYVESHSRKVTDIMTSNVLTVSADMPSAISPPCSKKRYQACAGGHGWQARWNVSRANLLQAIATIGKTIKTQGAVSDAALRERVVDELNSVPLARPALVNLIVNDGNIELWGIVESESEKRAARVAAEATPGVGAVVDHLMISRVKLFGE